MMEQQDNYLYKRMHDYIEYCGKMLKLKDREGTLKLALHIFNFLYEDRFLNGKNPRIYSSAIFYTACRLNGEYHIRQLDIAHVLEHTDAAIRPSFHAVVWHLLSSDIRLIDIHKTRLIELEQAIKKRKVKQ